MTDIVLDPLRLEAMEAGNLAVVDAWLVAEGDHVHSGQILARTTLVGERVDLLAPHDGVIEEILMPAGEPFNAGSPLARMVPF